MKNLTILLLAILFTVSLSAQTTEEEPKKAKNNEIKTLFGKIDSHGGYWALKMNYSQIDKQDAMFIGCRGAWVIGHGFSFGLGGGAFFNDNHVDDILSEDVSIQGGYGGFTFEGIILPKFPVHLTIPVFMGVGGVTYNSSVSNYNEEFWNSNYVAGDAFLILEPGAEIEFNILKAVRIGLAATYRFTSGVDLKKTADISLPKDVLNGLTLGITLKLGKF